MYKEPLMIDKYEALQELYLKDPLKPLQVSVIEFFEQRVGVEEEREEEEGVEAEEEGAGEEKEKEEKENENERIVGDTGGRKLERDGGTRKKSSRKAVKSSIE